MTPVKKFWKATRSSKTTCIPGFLTDDYDTVYLYTVTGFVDDQPQYVIEVDIDMNLLQKIDCEMDYGHDKLDILPGYICKKDVHAVSGSGAVIVWNEPISCKIVGCYYSCKNVKPGEAGYEASELIDGSYLKRDLELRVWSIDDMEKPPTKEEYSAWEQINDEKFGFTPKVSSLIKIASRILSPY